MNSDRGRLKQARKVSKITNGGAWVLLICLFTVREYRTYSIVLCCLYPLIVIVVGFCYRGLLSADEYEDSKVPSAAIAFIMPGMALVIVALMDFTTLAHPPLVWVAMALISIVFSVLYMVPTLKVPSDPIRFYGTGLLLIFLNLCYSYGLLIEANGRLDRSTPVKYETVVVDKRSSTGKHTTYYVELKPWGTLTEATEVRVRRGEYESAAKGDKVIVKQHAGYLNIPWIEIVL